MVEDKKDKSKENEVGDAVKVEKMEKKIRKKKFLKKKLLSQMDSL